MINIIDYTYFGGRLLIANAAESNYIQLYLNKLIEEKQYDFLQQLLGPVLYDKFATWYVTSPRDTTYNDILNGITFTYGGNQFNWVGIKKPLAAYVYYWYQRENATQTVSAGEVKTESQNATAQSSVQKMATAWNEMYNWVTPLISYMNANYNLYTDWFGYGQAGRTEIFQYNNPLF